MQLSSVQTSNICPVFSPCSNYFVTISNNNLYIKQACLDLKNHAQINLKQLKNNQNKLDQQSVKFSPNSKLLAVYNKKKMLILDLFGSLKAKIQDPESQIDCAIWTHDSQQILVFFSNVIYCSIYNLRTGETYFIRNAKIYSENGVAFSKGNNPGIFTAFLQKHSGKDCIGIYFSKTWQLINHLTLQTFDAKSIEFTQTGHLLVTENKINFKVLIVDVYKGVQETYGNKDYVMGVCCSKFSNNSMFLALGAHDDCIHLLNTQTWRLIAQIQITGDIDLTKTVVYKQQGEGKYSRFHGESRLKIGKNTQSKKTEEPPGISIMEFSFNDSLLAVKIDTMANSIFIYDLTNLTLVSVIVLGNKNIVRDMKWMDNENQESTLCIGYGTSDIMFWTQQMEDDLLYSRIPKNPAQEFRVGKIQIVNEKLIFYSNSMKKYVYAINENY